MTGGGATLLAGLAGLAGGVQRGINSEAGSRALLLASSLHGTAGSRCEAVSHREHGGGSGGQVLAKITAGEENVRGIITIAQSQKYE